VLNAGGGDDVVISATGNLAALIKITIDGGAGNDTIRGQATAPISCLAAAGNDFVDGQQGNDTVFLGSGDDLFQWDPGDGNDTVEGQGGNDTMLFNGSAGAEVFDLSANGERFRLTRNLGNIVMDVNDVEQIDLNALGNVDVINVGDLSGTDVTEVNVNLAVTIGGATRMQIDTVNVTATAPTIRATWSARTAPFGVGLQPWSTDARGSGDRLSSTGSAATTRARPDAPGRKRSFTSGWRRRQRTNLGSQGATYGCGRRLRFRLGDGGNDTAFRAPATTSSSGIRATAATRSRQPGRTWRC